MNERIIKKQKLLIFHPVLASYRIDQFNLLSEEYDLEVVFLFDQMWNFNMDQKKIEEQCHFKISYLLQGPRYKGRLFRFGMYKKIRQFNPDIIVGYEYSFTIQYLLLLKSIGLIKQKIGSLIDDSLDICIKVQSKLRRVIRDASVKKLDFIVVMSDEVSNFHRQKFNITENRIVISPILQLPERLRRNSEIIDKIARSYIKEYDLQGKKVLLFVGRFIPEKALTLFIETISQHLYSSDEYLLVLVGDGEELSILKDIVRDNNLEEKVLFPGKFQAENLYAWYTAASGFVLPSLSETFGAVVNEALIFGLSVMCSKYAGASTLINHDNGLVFDPLNKDETVETLTYFLESVKPVENVSVAEKKPLLDDHRNVFFKEWRKLAYV